MSVAVWGRPPLQPPPVTEASQLNVLCQWIDANFTMPRVPADGKPHTIQMESLQHLWQYIIEADDAPTVLACQTGEKSRVYGSKQNSDRSPTVDRDFTVAILRGHGFTTLMQTDKGVPARKEMLVASIAALRDTVRSLTGISEEWPLHYMGWDALGPIARPQSANVFVAGALIKFSTCNRLGEVAYDTQQQ
jgi:hypothetical protein